jgi:PAS domain S-box-containing protein
MLRRQATGKAPSRRARVLGSAPINEMKLFDASIADGPREAVDFITNILESSTEYSIVAADLKGKILLWNEGARRLYGYEQEEIVGKMYSTILHAPESVEAGLPKKMMQETLQHGKFEGTITHRRRNGDPFTERVVNTLRHDRTTGKAIGFLLISRDISEEIRMSQYARSLIEASLDPLVTISGEGKITDVNEATTKVTGVPRQKLIGADFSDYFTEPEKAREGYRQVFAKGMVTDYPLTIRHADGALTDVLYNASIYRDEHGAVLGAFAAARDVTAQKRAEAQIAEQRAKELERLAELERFQQLTMGRELRMIELKQEIEDLKKRVASGPVR